MILQCALVGAAATVTLVPPAEGTMLVLPLLPVSPGRTLEWVGPTGARWVAPGPYSGSLIVYGTRSALTAAALTHGALLLNSRFAACSSPARIIS